MTNDRQQQIVREWANLLDRDDVLILDTETTGVRADAEIVQLSAIRTTGATAFDAYVLPAGEVPAGASAIHGLTRERLMALGARPWIEHHETYATVLATVDVVLVYNLDYDVRLIRQTNQRYDMPHVPLQGRCIMKDYAAYRGVPGFYGDWKWHKLADAARHEQSAWRQDAIHNALVDCQAVLGLMQAVCARHLPG